jgi:hypothetical protein
MADTLSKYVFLDIDGVLNSDRYVKSRAQVDTNDLWTLEDIDPAAVGILNALVEKSGAKVVISSSWRHHHSLEEIRALLGERGFRGNVLDATPRLFGESRGTEIRTWLRVQVHEAHSFVVLDDDPATGELDARWVLTDPVVGLTDADVERALTLLAKMVPPPADG